MLWENPLGPQVQILKANSIVRANVSGFDFSNANFSGRDLSGTQFDSATSSAADFSNTTLSNASLVGAVLTAANLSNTELSDANLDQDNLTGATLTGVNLHQALLPSAIPGLPVTSSAVVVVVDALAVPGAVQVDTSGNLSVNSDSFTATEVNIQGVTIQAAIFVLDLDDIGNSVTAITPEG